MPCYVYKCPHCGVTAERMKRIDDRNKAPDCPECHHLMVLQISAPAPQFPGAASWRSR